VGRRQRNLLLPPALLKQGLVRTMVRSVVIVYRYKEGILNMNQPREVKLYNDFMKWHRKEITKAKEGMRQTKAMSVVESWTNIAIGCTINFTANMLILPLFGFESLTLGKNFLIMIVYTCIAFIRNYCIRRWFNKK
jgi:hypothetical protein